MSRKADRKSLGRGLSALLGEPEDAPTGSPSGPRADIPIGLIHPNPDQPRRHFGEEELEELAASIRERGVIQPVVLRQHPEKDKEFQIVAGERRWRAAQRAGLHALPALVKDLDDRTVLEIALVENVQREDLNAIEEAEGYARLIERFDYTQEALARIVGKSRSHLANTLRLNALPDSVKTALKDGRLTAGHARALLGSDQPDALATRVISEGLSVRATEALVRKTAATGATPTGTAEGARLAGRKEKDADTRILEGDLSAAIGMRAVLLPQDDGSGELRIRYRDFDELDRLCEKLTR